MDACPDCGQSKVTTAARCRRCAGLARRRAEHGTESGYARHLRAPDPDNGWPRTACADCLAAHCVEQRNRELARKRAREQARRARVTCPECGGRKTEQAKRCRACSLRVGAIGRPSTVGHGTDSGYYRHIRKPDPDNGWPRTACADCLAAHAAAARKRSGGKPFTPRTQHYCAGCDKPISQGAHYCRSCVRFARDGELPPRWQRVGLIWKEAS
jgi:hypothetical protein